MKLCQGGQPERFVMYTDEIHGVGQEGAADALTVICRGNDKPPHPYRGANSAISLAILLSNGSQNCTRSV
jgi:hypothetical protein